MKILVISLDKYILDPQSFVSQRSQWYGEITEAYTIIVPTKEKKFLRLSKTVTAYGSGGSNKLHQLWRIYRQAKELLSKERYDVISSQDSYYLGLTSLFLARRFHLGLEIQVLGIEKLKGIRKKIARYVLRKASTIRILSNRLYGRLLELFPLNKDRMFLVPIYVDVTKLAFQSSREENNKKQIYGLDRKTQKPYVHFLTVSRLISIKNIGLQVQTLKQLVEEYPDVRLHIVGDGEERNILERQVHDLDLEQYVFFHGWQDREALGHFYTQADCFLLTSHYEGWGMVIIEAAGAGLPIIMTDVGCANEVIKNGKSGFVIPVDDQAALFEAMRNIILNPKQRKEMGIAAKQAIDQLPTRDEVLSRYIASWQYAAEHRL